MASGREKIKGIDIQILQMEELAPLIIEQLEGGRSVTFTPTGNSMLPMLRHNADKVTLAPLHGELKKYDLPLYQRDNGGYVLHRVVETGDTYTMLGDNQFVKEYGIRHDQIIGIVTGFCRGGREHSVDETGYKLYCRLWLRSLRFRHLWRRAVRKLRRCLG